MLCLSKSRRAFTIVELLVVISIIGLLIGMLLPAVNAAREQGRRTECVNNIKQLGIGMQGYESKFKYFPHNRGTTDHTGYDPATKPDQDKEATTNVDGYSWITQILPHIEEDVIYSKINLERKLDFKDSQYDNLLAAQQKINILICPSDVSTNPAGLTTNSRMYPSPTSGKPPVNVGTTNYKGCAGANWRYSVNRDSLAFALTLPTALPIPIPANCPLTIKTYLGRDKIRNVIVVTAPTSSDDGLDNGNGVICRNNLTYPDPKHPTVQLPPILTSSIDIRDGLSHTFAIGEVLVDACYYNAWYWFDGTTATCALPLNYKVTDRPDLPPDPANVHYWKWTYGFSSRHPMGANFAMCDGSVRFVANNIDLNIYHALATINGGELVNNE
jgi:prepilin-type N-terminal cleavage/methylation domain-containing protein/prepilin-type processing-associated H-X9-DG protein